MSYSGLQVRNQFQLWHMNECHMNLMSWYHCLGQWFPVSKLRRHETWCLFCFSFSLLNSTEERNSMVRLAWTSPYDNSWLDAETLS